MEARVEVFGLHVSQGCVTIRWTLSLSDTAWLEVAATSRHPSRLPDTLFRAVLRVGDGPQREEEEGRERARDLLGGKGRR